MTRPDCWILILDGYKLWKLWPAGLDFYRWSTGELSWPFGGKNIYLYLGFFRKPEKLGSHIGSKWWPADPGVKDDPNDPLTRWPNDQVPCLMSAATTRSITLPKTVVIDTARSVVGRIRWSVVFENGGDNSLFHADGIIILPIDNKKLSYRRVTARCVLSVVILPITTQQCRNYLYDDKSWPNRWYEVGGLVGGNVS